MTTTHRFNETAIERELRFLDMHIERLELLQQKHEDLERELRWDDEPPTEDRVHDIYSEMTDLEIELVLLPAAYERKAKLEEIS